MSHQSPALTFWADKKLRWVARARGFNLATATSAVNALNEYISQSAGSLSTERVVVEQGSDGLFAWTPSSLRLLRQMGEDVSVLDDIGRTSASASPVKGTHPSPPPPSPPPEKSYRAFDICGFRGGVVRPAQVSGLGTTAASVGRGGDGVFTTSPAPQNVPCAALHSGVGKDKYLIRRQQARNGYAPEVFG